MPIRGQRLDLTLVGVGFLVAGGWSAILAPSVRSRWPKLAESLALGGMPEFDALAPAVTLALVLSCGLAAIITGFAGLAQFVSTAEGRRTTLVSVLLVTFTLVVLGVLGTVAAPSNARTETPPFQPLSDVQPPVEERPERNGLLEFNSIRLAAAVIGAAAGVTLALGIPPYSQQKTTSLAVLGALFGWIAAYVLVGVALFWLLRPYLGGLLARVPNLASRHGAPPPGLPPPDPTAQIEALRRRIDWARQQGNLPPHVVQTEIARLESEIRQLGGTP